MEVTPEDIRTFWFGNHQDTAAIAKSQSPLWWGKSDSTDLEIAEQFGEAIVAAAAGQLNHWLETANGRLALIILIDQFSRNVYRDTPAAFAHDHLARQWTLDGLSQSLDAQLRPIERVFFYLPLEHSELLEDQIQCVNLFNTLADAAPNNEKALFQGFADFADQHHAIISRFGRYPHRNKILGRNSTPEEIEFLKQPGSSF